MTPLELSLITQGSPEWKQARVGFITGSRLSDVIAMTKKGESAERAKYRAELICERLTRQPYPQFVSREMQWGLDHEQEARVAYEIERDVLVDTVGFIVHPHMGQFFGCSPDGLVGDDGLMQIKCPLTKTHLEWMMAGVVPLEHVPQMLAELACHPTRQWADFVSFDPRLPAHLQLFVRRLERNEKLILSLEAEVSHFNDEIEKAMDLLPKKPAGIVLAMDQGNGDEVQF